MDYEAIIKTLPELDRLELETLKMKIEDILEKDLKDNLW